MLPQTKALLEVREFLDSLMTATPAESALDFLTNNGDLVIDHVNEALGIDAFQVGDKVRVEPRTDALTPFSGTVVSKRLDDNGVPLFTVSEHDDDKLECVVSELQLEELA